MSSAAGQLSRGESSSRVWLGLLAVFLACSG
jgi:hypothetical protein